MEKDEKIFTFRLPVPLLNELHELAEKMDLSLAQLIRKVAREFVEKNHA